MITTRQFAAKLNAIQKSDETLRAAVCDALAFAVFHSTTHKNKDPIKRLQEAVSGIKWLSSALSKVQMPVANKKYTEQDAESFAVFAVRGIWEGQQAKREQARDERKTRGRRIPSASDAKKPGPVESPTAEELTGAPMDTPEARPAASIVDDTPEAVCTLTGLDGVAMELSVDEYEAALQTVMLMRMEQRVLKVA